MVLAIVIAFLTGSFFGVLLGMFVLALCVIADPARAT